MKAALAGRCVLVTRPAKEKELSELLRLEGADVLEAPAIETLPVEDTTELDTAVKGLAGGEFEWVALSSPRAVHVVVERLRALDLTLPTDARVAAVGPGTARALRHAGMRVHLMADPHTTASLGHQFPDGRGRVLLPRADIAPAALEEQLAEKGWKPVRVDAYRTRIPDLLPDDVAQALEEGRVDAVCFTSASTVRGFVSMAGARSEPPAVCIGPVTAEAAREAGLNVAAVADPHTIGGLVEAVRRTLVRR